MSKYLNILAIDFGDKRVGLARGDTDTFLSRPYKIIENKGMNFLISEISEIISEADINLLVLGYPLSLSGKYTKQTEKIDNFYNFLKNNLDLEIIKVNEQLSSRQAKSILHADSISGRVDDIAAMIFLDSFLNSIKKDYES
jgi:putative Holliday junction resolvase